MSDPDSIFERRKRYIERQREMKPDTVNVRFQNAQPEGSGAANRHGMPAVPVGQHLVRNWPVLDLGEQPEISLDTWKLEVGGLVENPVTLDWQQFMALPQVEDVSDFHCVTTWSKLDVEWKGVAFTTVAALARPRADATHVMVHGYDGYTTNLPLEEALKDDVLLVHTAEGKPLPREHGGPVRMITPQLYAWKGSKWIKRIEFLTHDRPGFWETRGYSNSAHPWRDDRYS
jgi:DMSO/TMAO reductase YedYZ molybdopterin-dependent catalytic subunit